MLEQSDMAHYLLSLGLVKPRDVLEEGLTIADMSRRNCVYVATTRAGPTYVVKQSALRTASTLTHEAAILRALAEEPELAQAVPTVMLDDAEEARLVLRTPGSGRSWSEQYRAGRGPRTAARALGRMLATLHRLPAHGFAAPAAAVDRMWGLSLPEPSHELRLSLSAGALDLVSRLQASHATCERLHELLQGAGSDGALVHGDLRWENCLTLAAPGSRRTTRVLLIDWELAGPGTTEFDVGTVLAEYLRFWVGSIPIVDPTDPGRLAARAGHPLLRLLPAVQAFWASYRLANPARPALRRVIELAAVRLLQSAVEHAQGLVTPSAHLVALLQLADNMLRDPDDAALRLLGLRESPA
jgi:Ser/Thr protein kinase RdoA (MazF antagonist)